MCILSCFKYMHSAMDALFTESYFDKYVQDSARAVAMEAVADFTNEIKKLEIDNNEAKRKIIEKLETIGYSIMGPDEILDKTKIAEMYEELGVDGSESLLEIYSSMDRLNSKILREECTSWKKKLLLNGQAFSPKYFMNDNILSMN